jgi:hypothetical protein
MEFIYFIAVIATASPVGKGGWAAVVKDGMDNGLQSMAKIHTNSFSTDALQEVLPKLNPTAKEFSPIGKAPKSAVIASSAISTEGIPFEENLIGAISSPWKRLPRPFELEETPSIKQDPFISNFQTDIDAKNLKSSEGFEDPLADILPWKPLLRRPFALEETPAHSGKSILAVDEKIPDVSASSIISRVDKVQPSDRASSAKKKTVARQFPQVFSGKEMAHEGHWKQPHWSKSTTRENLPEMKQNERWANAAENGSAFKDKRWRRRGRKLALSSKNKEWKNSGDR